MPRLFDPLTIKSITLRNRIGVSPMCQYSSLDGTASDWHLVHLGSRAAGGAALVIAEATAVSPEGRISPGDAGLWQEKQIPPLQRITQFIQEQGAVAGIQLAHAGRKGSADLPWKGGGHLKNDEGGWDIIGPSALAFGNEQWKVPREATLADIQKVKADFIAATKRALTAGYQWLEIHAAHGYLLHSFYSPLTNKRQDNYGGSFENRIRLTLETVQAVRQEWPDRYPLSVRISCSDWVVGGWTIEESILLAQKLKESGVDVIDCSSGFATPDIKNYPFGFSFQVPFSRKIKEKTSLLTAAVGMIVSPEQADSIIHNGEADIVLLGREMLRSPYWPAEAAKKLRQPAEAIHWPLQYGYALKRG